MKEWKRKVIQFMAAVLSNANLKGFLQGSIWQGKSKSLCVPGLNCYSCPGAIGACPIGALQASLTGNQKGFPYYVVGTLLLFGVLFGRLICGFLCMFGLIQELLYKIKTPKIEVPAKVDKILRYLKYVVLLLFVILLPILITDQFGIGDPWFCKYICPVGTLEGGIFLMIKNDTLRAMAGFLFSWKIFLLLLCAIASISIYRPFCKYICPLGAIYGVFNRISFFKMSVEKKDCINCGACKRACKMNVDVVEDINSNECIRCLACKNVCPTGCIKITHLPVH